MTDSSPRWPGSDGSPGLDFSPRRPQGDSGSGSTAPAAAPRDSVTSVQTPPRAGESEPEQAATSSPAAAVAAPPVNQPPPFGPSFTQAPRNGDADTQSREDADARAQETNVQNQQSAASWAWQPLDANSAGQRPNRAADGTAARSASGPDSGAVAAGAAGGVIAGAAARAADQSRRDTSARRPTPTSAASATPSAATRRVGNRRTRKARLRLARLDPWSVMKTTFLFSIAFGIMMMVVAWVLWMVLSGSGALESLNQFLTTLIGNQGDAPFRIEDFINAPRVLGFAAVLAAIDVVILTAVATLFAFLYNLAATVIGGLEVTLAED